MEMDWGDDDDTMHKEKSKLSDKESTKTSLKNKFADIMAKPPTPQVYGHTFNICLWGLSVFFGLNTIFFN